MNLSPYKKQLSIVSYTLLRLTLILSLMLGSYITQASAVDLETQTACKTLPQLQKTGQSAYRQKHYSSAVKAFIQQAAWSDYCQQNAENAPIAVSDRMRDIAYNNVGISYAKWGKPLWALAWYNIAPNSRESQFNRSKILPLKLSKSLLGNYVQYAGQGAWNRLTLKQVNAQYQLRWTGLNMKRNGLIMGPNIGEFQLQAATQRHLQYQQGGCTIDVVIGGKSTIGQRLITLHSTGDFADCGFGNGVVANGQYVQVEAD